VIGGPRSYGVPALLVPINYHCLHRSRFIPPRFHGGRPFVHLRRIRDLAEPPAMR
jgi:hypothetical protein